MARKSARAATGKRAKTPPPERASLAALNRWMAANHEALLKRARENCVRLTGKPTFGGSRRKKSA